MRRLAPLALVFLLALGYPSAPLWAQEQVEPSRELKQPDVAAALRWLANKQGADGSWGAKDKLALTGMSGLALLASGSTAEHGPFAQQIRRAIRFVLTCQKDDGMAFKHGSSGYSAIHNHGYALLFLTQAYGEAGALDKDLQYAIKQGVKATIRAQYFQPKASDGGFGYFLVPGRAPTQWKHMWNVDEASTTISQIQALRGARNAGFPVPKRALERAGAYLAKCVHPPTGGFVYSNGRRRISFIEGSNRPTFAITAASTAVLHALGNYDGPLVDGGITYIQAFRPPSRKKVPFYYYAHYYAAQVMYMKGGAQGKKWLGAVRAELAERQRSDGKWGADAEDSLAPGDSEVLNTAWALQVCQIESGFLPIHER